MKSRMLAGGAALAAMLLGVTLAAGTATAQPTSDASATPRAESCEGKTRGQKTVWMKYDEFQEGRGVTYLKHCQDLRVNDGAGMDVECTSKDLAKLDPIRVEETFTEFRALGYGQVAVSCKDLGSPTKEAYTRNFMIGVKMDAKDVIACKGTPSGQGTSWVRWDSFTEGRGVIYLKRCQALRLYDGAGEEVECQTPDLDASIIDLYDVQVEYQVWRSMGNPGTVTLTCTEAGSGEEYSKTIQIITKHQPAA
ncbi:MAG: hypothetical protein RL347_130 [Actinomycetota bacterium]|jgi:phage gp45-like